MDAWRTLLPWLAVAALACAHAAAQDTCQTDLQCPYAKFCHQPRNAAVSGWCQPCWKCCLFGSSYGKCPDSCNCGVGITCYSKGNCGDGLYCQVGSSDTEPPRCQACTECWNDTQSVAGSCSEDCPSGELQSLALLSERQRSDYVFTQFAAVDLFPSEEGWDMAAFGSWLQQEAATSSTLAGYASPPGLAPVQIESAFAAFDYDNDGRVKKKEWINASLSLTAASFLCANTSGQLYAITYQGCPCTMRGSRGGGSVCAAGLMCTWQPLAGHGPLAASSLLPTATDTSAVCVPCLPGQYCPQGTAYQLTSGPRSAPSLTCPEGYLCPTPSEVLRCPAGAYCPPGSTSSRTCDMGSLSRLGWAGNVTVTQSIVQRLRSGQDQVQGNHCPVGSSSPLTVCSGGSFCPEPSRALQCPAGHFCLPGSSQPRRCKPLSPCPPGTLKPRFSWMFLLLLGIIVVAAATVWWLLLKWEVWGLAVAAPDGADTHTGPASSWASAAGAQRQPSVVATASWELQQLLDWYGGPPADVQRSLRRLHIPTASQKKLSAAATARAEADAAAAGDVFCELAVPAPRAGAPPGGRRTPRTSGIQASALQYDSSTDAPWLIADSPPARQQQQQQRGRSSLRAASSRPLGEGSEEPSKLPGSVSHTGGSTPVRVAPLLAAASGGLEAGDGEVSAAASGQHYGGPAGGVGDAAAAAAAEETRAQLLAAYGATEQHGRLADLLHHSQQQQQEEEEQQPAYASPHGEGFSVTDNSSSAGPASSWGTPSGQGRVPLKEAAYAAMRSPAHAAAAGGAYGSSTAHAAATASSWSSAAHMQHNSSQQHTPSGPQQPQHQGAAGGDEEHHGGGRSLKRQLSQKAVSAVKAAVAVTGRSMRRLAQYRSGMQTVEAAGGGDKPGGGRHTPGSPYSSTTGNPAGAGSSSIATAPGSGAATSSQGVSPRSLSMMNKSAVFQEELLRVQRSARTRQMERSAASWTTGGSLLGAGAVAGGALDGSFSARPGSFTAAGRLGLASAMAPRAGSMTGAQWRLAAASAAAMAARKGAESPEEPIDVAAVPTVTVDFDIQHVSMPRRGAAASSDAAAAGADAQRYQCVLNRVQGCFQPYTISCLLGPSGSGKSTLLDVLRGRLLLSPPDEEEQVAASANPFRRAVRGVGRVLYDGLPAGDTRVAKLVGFVPQDDIIHTDLTVWENLLYGAALRQPQGTSRADWQELVAGVVSLLALRGVQHSMVGSVERRGISGGQRKRVNIGMELVGQPSVLYLDEPTSGLDANASMSVVRGLQTISRLGMTLLLVAHQPRYALFRMFHQALVLGPASELVFCGPPLLAAPYFEALGFRRLPAENPADWLMDIVGGTAVQEAASGHLSMAGPGGGSMASGWGLGVAPEGAAAKEQEEQRGMQLAAVWRQRGLAWAEEATRLNRALLDLATAPAVNLSGATVCLLVNQLATVLPDPHQKVPRDAFCRQVSAPLCWGSLGMDAHAVGQLLQCLGLGEQQLVTARAVELALVASTGTFAADAEGELLLPSWGPGSQGGTAADAGTGLFKPGEAAGAEDSSNHSAATSMFATGMAVGGAAGGVCGGEVSLHGAVLPARPGSGCMYPQQPQALTPSGRSVLGQTRRPASCGGRSSSSRTSASDHSSSASGNSSSSSSSRRSSWSSADGGTTAGPADALQQQAQAKGSSRPLAVTIPGSPERGSPAFFDPAEALQGAPLRSPACTPRTDLLPITPGRPSARSRASQTPTGCISTPRQQQQQQQQQQQLRQRPSSVRWSASTVGSQGNLPKGASCPELAALDAQAPRVRSASPAPSDSTDEDSSTLPPRRASHPSGGGLTRSSSLPEQHHPWVVPPAPPPPPAAAAVVQNASSSRKALAPAAPTTGGGAVVGGAMSGPSYSTPAAPMDAPSQQQLSPREGWQQLMSARHAQQQQQQQQQQPRRSPRTEGRSPREQPPPAAASRTSGAADLAVAERQPSVALKIGRLLSGAAASASAAWGHLVGGGSRSGWVDAEQLRQLQEREQEAKQKARHKEEVLAYAAAHQQPSVWRQLRWLLLRGLLKQRRAWTWATPPTPLVDLLLVVGAGLIVGFIHSGHDTLQQAPQQALMTMTTLGVLCSMVHLRTLCGNRALLLREVESGVGVVPSYVAQVVVDLVWVVLLPLVFTSMYYYTSLPEMPFGTYYAAAAGVCWWLSGCAYLVAALLPIKSTTVTGVFLALVFGVFLNGTNPTIADSRHAGPGAAAVRAALSLSFNRWALELLTLSEFRMYGPDKQTAVMAICRALGLCRLDVFLPDDGDGNLSEREALAYLRLQEAWRPQFCDGARRAALLTLLLGGAVLRVVAGCVLRVTSHLKYWRA